MNLNKELWKVMRENQQRLFRPEEVYEAIARVYPNPLREYEMMESQGKIVPASYRNGRVDKVRFDFSKKDVFNEF